MRDIAVFSGSAHRELAAEVCAELNTPLLPVRTTRFANDCLEVQLQANCRERDVFLIQPLVQPVQEHLVELLLMLDAARGASAARTTVVMPHYAYARSDKKDAPRISIGGRLVADLMVAAGANRVLAMTLHSPQVHGFFSIPVDHLHALRELAGHFRQYDLARTTVVSPDLGNAKDAASFARMLGVPVAAGAKQRFADDRVAITSVIGDRWPDATSSCSTTRSRRAAPSSNSSGCSASRASAPSGWPVPTVSSPTVPSNASDRCPTWLRSFAPTPFRCPGAGMAARNGAPTSSPFSASPRRLPRRCGASTMASR